MHTFIHEAKVKDPFLAVREMAARRASGATAPATDSAELLRLFGRSRLTPVQRRIAQFLVEHPAEASYLSTGEVATQAAVSQPSVTRFAVALGFAGYPALRREMRQLTRASSAESAEDVRRNELQSAVAEELANIARLDTLLGDPEPIQRAGRLLAESSPLPVLGLRASSGLAHYFAFFGAKVHPDVRLLSAGGSRLLDRLEQAAVAGATALLAFVLPRYPRETIEALQRAQRLGIEVVVITDNELSPAAAVADLLLPASVGSRLVFDSQAAPMLLAMVLLQQMCDVQGASAQERLEEFERSAAERGVFTTD